MQNDQRGAVLRALAPLGAGQALVAVMVGATLGYGFAILLGWLR